MKKIALFLLTLIAGAGIAQAGTFYDTPTYSTTSRNASMGLVGNFHIYRSTTQKEAIVVMGSSWGIHIIYGLDASTMSISNLLTATSGYFSALTSTGMANFPSGIRFGDGSQQTTAGGTGTGISQIYSNGILLGSASNFNLIGGLVASVVAGTVTIDTAQSTFTFYGLKSGGPVYVATTPFVAVPGTAFVVGKTTMNVTEIQAYAINTSTVGSTFFRIAVATATDNGLPFNYVTPIIEVSTNNKYSAWISTGFSLYPGAVFSLHVTSTPASGNLPEEYGLVVRYTRRETVGGSGGSSGGGTSSSTSSINNTDTLQTGASYYVQTGTVAGNLYASNAAFSTETVTTYLGIAVPTPVSGSTFQIGSSTLVVTSSGAVGMGVQVPGATLHVKGQNTNNAPQAIVEGVNSARIYIKGSAGANVAELQMGLAGSVQAAIGSDQVGGSGLFPGLYFKDSNSVKKIVVGTNYIILFGSVQVNDVIGSTVGMQVAQATITGNSLMINGLPLQFPSADGTNGQVLGTNGRGILSFVTPSGTGGGSIAFIDQNGVRTVITTATITGVAGNILGSSVTGSNLGLFVDGSTLAKTNQVNVFTQPQVVQGSMTVGTGVPWWMITSTGSSQSVPEYSSVVNMTSNTANPTNTAWNKYFFLRCVPNGNNAPVCSAVVGYTYSTNSVVNPGAQIAGLLGIAEDTTQGKIQVVGHQGIAHCNGNEPGCNGAIAEADYYNQNQVNFPPVIGFQPFINITGPDGVTPSTVDYVFNYISPNPNIGKGNLGTFAFYSPSTWPFTVGVSTISESIGGQGNFGIGTLHPTQREEIWGVSPATLWHDITGVGMLVQASVGGFGVVETTSPGHPLVFGVGNSEAGRIQATKQLYWVSGSTWGGIVWSTTGFNGGNSTYTQLMVNGVAYQWPSAQGAAGTFMRNDGTGIMTWATPTSGSGGSGIAVQNSTGGAWTTPMSSGAASTAGRFASLVQFQIGSGSFTLVSPSTQPGSFGTNFVLTSTDGSKTYFHSTSSGITITTATVFVGVTPIFFGGAIIQSTFAANGLVGSNALNTNGVAPLTGQVYTNAGDGTLGLATLLSSSMSMTDGSTYTYHVNVAGGRPAFQAIVNGANTFEIGQSSITHSTPTVFNATTTFTAPVQVGSSMAVSGPFTSSGTNSLGSLTLNTALAADYGGTGISTWPVASVPIPIFGWKGSTVNPAGDGNRLAESTATTPASGPAANLDFMRFPEDTTRYMFVDVPLDDSWNGSSGTFQFGGYSTGPVRISTVEVCMAGLSFGSTGTASGVPLFATMGSSVCQRMVVSSSNTVYTSSRSDSFTVPNWGPGNTTSYVAWRQPLGTADNMPGDLLVTLCHPFHPKRKPQD